MTDQSVFDQDDKQISGDVAPVIDPDKAPPKQQDAPLVNTFEDLLGEIKNESGERKYDSVPKALEGLRNAQEYIPQLKTELSSKEKEIERLREELAKRESVEDVVERLTSGKVIDGQPSDGGLDEQKIQQLVQNLLQKNTVEEQQSQNFQIVNSTLVEKFGSIEKAKEAVVAKAQELGISVGEVGELAKKSPKAVLAYFISPDKQDIKTNSLGLNTHPFQKGKQEISLEKPEKSLLSGATSRQQAEYMKRIRDKVYADLGVET